MDGMLPHIIASYILCLSILLGILLLAIGILARHTKTKIIAVVFLLLCSVLSVIFFYISKANLGLGWQQLKTSETLVHLHQENMNLFLGTAILLGTVSFTTLILYFKKSKLIKLALIATIFLSIVVSIVSFVVTKSGSEIIKSDKTTSIKFIEIE